MMLMVDIGISDYSVYQLLWFRPLSPLNYALPSALLALNWHSTTHVPIDVLQPCTVNSINTQISASDLPLIVILSSPTAAHIAAQWAWQPIHTIAVMGIPSKLAWQHASGIEPLHWIVSPTGESMGLFHALNRYASITVVRANQGRNDLIHNLTANGVQVNVLTAYHKQDLTQTDLFKQRLNAIHSINKTMALYFTSTDQVPRVLKTLSNINTACQQTALFNDSLVLASHPRIQNAAHQLGFRHVHCI
jgi:uroporphyrinogen-III synthase